MKIRTLLIDNDHESLVRLRNSIERYCPILKIIGETHYPKNSIELISFIKPQLVFINLSLKNMAEFEALTRIENPFFEVIYVSTFDYHHMDDIPGLNTAKLIRPNNNEDLRLSVHQAFDQIKQKNMAENAVEGIGGYQSLKLRTNRIAIPTQEGMEFIKIEDIIHCQGVDGYTKLFFGANKILLSSRSIGHFTRLLEKFGFHQVHKSHLINLSHICKYLNEGYVVLKNEDRVPVSRNKRIDFLNTFKSLVP